MLSKHLQLLKDTFILDQSLEPLEYAIPSKSPRVSEVPPLQSLQTTSLKINWDVANPQAAKLPRANLSANTSLKRFKEIACTLVKDSTRGKKSSTTPTTFVANS